MKSRILKIVFQGLTCALLLSVKTQNISAYAGLDDYILNDNSCDYSFHACRCSPIRVNAECLYWQIKESPRIPPLVITGLFDDSVTPTLQTAGTKIVLGNKTIRDPGRFGLKLSAAYSFERGLCFDTEISGMFLQRQTHSKRVRSNDYRESKVTSADLPENAFLAVPFFDVTTGKESSAYIARPDEFAGKATLKINNSMHGGELNVLMSNCSLCTDHLAIQGLVGFRYWRFYEKLTFTTDSQNTIDPNVFTTIDVFSTNNVFYGGQIGFATKYDCNWFSCRARAQVALGVMDKRLSIRGNLLTNDFNNLGRVLEFPGGYFALPSNIGFYDTVKFACIPEFSIDCQFKISNCSYFHLGYTFLYVSNIFRAENQIDRKIDPTQSSAITRQFPTSADAIESPKALLNSRDFWAHGLNFGFEYFF